MSGKCVRPKSLIPCGLAPNSEICGAIGQYDICKHWREDKDKALCAAPPTMPPCNRAGCRGCGYYDGKEGE
jgi:hypothetical protein